MTPARYSLQGSLTATRRFTSAPLHPFWFDVGPSIQLDRTTNDGGSISGTSLDTNILTYTGPTVSTDWLLDVRPKARTASETITITSGNIGRAAIEGQTAKWVSDGAVTITLASPTRTASVTLLMASTEPGSSTAFTSWRSGSFAKHCTDTLDSLTAGKDASARAMFSTQNHAASIYVRNTACWCNTATLRPYLAAISPWNSGGANTQAGVAITPRHVLLASHYLYGPGTAVRFIAPDNSVIERTFQAFVQVGIDTTIGRLSADLPNTISPLKFLTATASNKLPKIHHSSPDASMRLPMLVLDQEEKALIRDLYWFDTASKRAVSQLPTDAQRLVFSEQLIVGDSGNPALMVTANELVLVNVWHSIGIGDAVHLLTTEINAAINTLSPGGGYAVSTVDLSSFNTY